MKKFTTLRHILPSLFQERQWQDAWQVQGLYGKWPHIAGEEAARHSRPVALRGQTLWLYVSHAIWAQELLFRQRELLRRIRPLAADRSIAGFRCVVEPSWFAATGPAPGQQAAPARPLPSSFQAIADQSSREALGRLWQLWQERHSSPANGQATGAGQGSP